MSWWLVIWLSAGAYLLKLLGLVVLGGRKLPATDTPASRASTTISWPVVSVSFMMRAARSAAGINTRHR
ncbi:MAG: hypothetical protein ACKORY_01705, partial [Actinomycetota bacterium]